MTSSDSSDEIEADSFSERIKTRPSIIPIERGDDDVLSSPTGGERGVSMSMAESSATSEAPVRFHPAAMIASSKQLVLERDVAGRSFVAGASHAVESWLWDRRVGDPIQGLIAVGSQTSEERVREARELARWLRRSAKHGPVLARTGDDVWCARSTRTHIVLFRVRPERMGSLLNALFRIEP